MRYRPIPHHLKSITSIRHSWQIPTVRYSSVAPEHNGALLRRFVPDPIKDGEVDGEGDGSDVYQSAKETTERWDVPAGTPLMGVRLGDLTPTEIYAANAPLSYYLRMDTTPKRMVHLIRHHGSILPFCEVVHIVHPHTAFHLAHSGSPPDVSEQAWERVKKAVSGENQWGAKILASVLHSPANLRAIPRNMAAFSTMMLRFQSTGEEPNYKDCWARSTVLGYAKYQKAVEPQHQVVSASLGGAMAHIGNGAMCW